MNKIQTLLTTIVLLFGISGSGVADFNDGWVAYQKGDYKTAFNEWKPLAELGNSTAQGLLGTMYENGEGVPQDDKEAFKWYLKSAEQNNRVAQQKIGFYYENGKGILTDHTKAVEWYR